MYRGFNLQLDRKLMDEIETEEIEQFLRERLVKLHIEKGLKNYLNTAAILDGTKMQEDWFPTVDARVFISHSHQDEKLAGGLAFMLYDRFKIDSFIDSFVWGYADELLKAIDNEYCLNVDKRTYDYEKRNYSTSHVHMMLSTALTKMIDKAECLLFLNTPNSVSTNGIMAQTYSPWIYHEIATTKIIRQNPPDRVKEQIRGLTKEAAEKSLKIGYKMNFDNLSSLNATDLKEWLNSGMTSPDRALDWLYENVKPVVKSNGRFFAK